MLFLIAQGISFGFSAGAMPGPLTSYMISLTLAYGWRRSIMLAFVPPVADIPFILATLFILRQVPPEFIRIIQIVGGLYLLWIAWNMWKQMRLSTVIQIDSAPAQRGFMQGVLMAWLSPGPYIFWSTILGPLLITALNQSIVHAVTFLLAFYGVFLTVMCGYVLVFDRLRRLDERIVKTISRIVLVVLVIFALQLIGQGTGLLT